MGSSKMLMSVKSLLDFNMQVPDTSIFELIYGVG
jgi:hypothetical protein